MSIVAFAKSCIRSFVIVLAAGVLMTVTAAGAQAHTSLVSSTPAEGQVVTSPLANITLTFAEDLLPSADTISLNDGQGNVVTSQQVQPSGAEISIPWPSDLPSGPYEIAYRVVASDGHPLIGAVQFTYEGAAATASTPPVTPSPVATVSVATSVAPSPESTTSPGINTMTLGIILLAVLVVFGFVLTVRRRKRP